MDRPAEGMKLKKSVIVPRKGISELKKVLENNEGSAKVSFNEGFFTVQSEIPGANVTMGVRLVDGQFPDYNQVLPKEKKTTVTANRANLLSTIKRVALVTTDRSKTIKVDIAGNNMTLSSSSPEYGEALEAIEIEKDGDDVSIGFSARYLIDLLSTMSSEEQVNINLNGELGPGIFLGDSDSNYRSVVMPMRFE